MPCKKKAPRCAHDHLHPFLCLMREMPHLHGHGFVALVHGGREGALLVQLVAPLQAELLGVCVVSGLEAVHALGETHLGVQKNGKRTRNEQGESSSMQNKRKKLDGPL